MAKPIPAKDPSARSARISVVVAGLITVLLTCAIWGAFYFGFLREKWKLKQKIARQLIQRQKLLVRLHSVGHENAALEQPETINPEQAIPNITDISDLLDAISNEADSAGMVLMNFEEKKETAAGLLVEIPIEITLTGQYDGLIQFVDSLSHFSRLTAIKKMHLTVFSASDESVTLYVTLVLSAYRGQMS